MCARNIAAFYITSNASIFRYIVIAVHHVESSNTSKDRFCEITKNQNTELGTYRNTKYRTCDVSKYQIVYISIYRIGHKMSCRVISTRTTRYAERIPCLRHDKCMRCMSVMCHFCMSIPRCVTYPYFHGELQRNRAIWALCVRKGWSIKLMREMDLLDNRAVPNRTPLHVRKHLQFFAHAHKVTCDICVWAQLEQRQEKCPELASNARLGVLYTRTPKQRNAPTAHGPIGVCLVWT